MSDKILTVKNLSKSFGKKLVLNDLSFDIYQGDLVGLVGINGSGKTTLFKCLTGLLQCDGQIEICGISLKKREKYLQNILYVFDKDTAFCEMTGYQVLKDFACFYGKFSKQDILDILNQVGLLGSENIALNKYSLGMKKRLNIAKIIIAKPKLVVMDEPFNGIDVQGVDNMIYEIKRLNHDYGTTFIVSSHQVNELEKFSTRILGIVQGKLTIDRYVEDESKILVAIKLVDENNLDLIKQNYLFKYTKNDIHYFECDSDKKMDFVKFLNENNIFYTYFDTNNAIKKEVYSVLGGDENE